MSKAFVTVPLTITVYIPIVFGLSQYIVLVVALKIINNVS